MCCLLLLLALALRPCLGCINDSTIERAEAEFRGSYAIAEPSPDPGTSTLWGALGLVGFLVIGGGAVVAFLVRLQADG